MTGEVLPRAGATAAQGVELRARARSDFPALAALWIESWTQAMPDIDFSARRDWLCAHLDALEAAGGETICAFDRSGRALGFAAVNPRTGYLDQIAVAAQAKGSGVAALLLDAARRVSAAPLCLDVNQDNPRALAFYRREGFAPVAEGVNPMSGLRTWRLQTK